MTPEGVVKKSVKALLAKYKIYPAKDAGAFPEDAQGWYWMPIKGASFGVRGVPDFEGHYQGWYFGIETKRKTKTAEGFQALQVQAIRSSGGAVFIVDGEESLVSFEEWLRRKAR